MEILCAEKGSRFLDSDSDSEKCRSKNECVQVRRLKWIRLWIRFWIRVWIPDSRFPKVYFQKSREMDSGSSLDSDSGVDSDSGLDSGVDSGSGLDSQMDSGWVWVYSVQMNLVSRKLLFGRCVTKKNKGVVPLGISDGKSAISKSVCTSETSLIEYRIL